MKKIILSCSLILFLWKLAPYQDFKDLFLRLNTFDQFQQYDEVDLEILEASKYLLSVRLGRS